MVPQLEAAGLMFVGKDETGERMEVVELQESPSGHPFYAAAQVCFTSWSGRLGKSVPLVSTAHNATLHCVMCAPSTKRGSTPLW
jgi:CTP synthase (UTP-ammonia lyase)